MARLSTVVLLCVVASICTVEACKYRIGSKEYDLGALSSPSDYTGERSYFVYHLNFCRDIVQAGGECRQSSLCSFWKADMEPYKAMGGWSRNPEPTVTEIPTGIRVAWTNGDSTCGSQKEGVTINLACDKNVVKPSTFTVEEYPETCQTVVTMSAAAGCGKAVSGGLSGGSIFLILFFVLVPVYLIGGAIYKNKTKGSTGIEMIPNIDFWRSIPGYTKLGCLISFNKVKALTSGNKGGSPNGQFEQL